MQPYIVRQGDHLTAIAARMGFNPDEVWAAAANEALRERRSSPDMLAPGDILHVPRQPPPAVELAAHRTNRYRGRRLTVPVNLRLQLDGEPLASQRCVVEGMGPPLETQTDSAGALSLEAPAHVSALRVVLPERNLSLDVDIGHLDPAEEDSGVAQRLLNLGYLAADYRALPERLRQVRMEAALGQFQREHDLEATGAADEGTLHALTEAAGR